MVIAGGCPSCRARRAEQLQQALTPAQAMLRAKVCILHCVTEYPAPAHSLNLTALQSLKQTFGLNTGYSDHSLGIWALVR